MKRIGASAIFLLAVVSFVAAESEPVQPWATTPGGMDWERFMGQLPQPASDANKRLVELRKSQIKLEDAKLYASFMKIKKAHAVEAIEQLEDCDEMDRCNDTATECLQAVNMTKCFPKGQYGELCVIQKSNDAKGVVAVTCTHGLVCAPNKTEVIVDGNNHVIYGKCDYKNTKPFELLEYNEHGYDPDLPEKLLQDEIQMGRYFGDRILKYKYMDMPSNKMGYGGPHVGIMGGQGMNGMGGQGMNGMGGQGMNGMDGMGSMGGQGMNGMGMNGFGGMMPPGMSHRKMMMIRKMMMMKMMKPNIFINMNGKPGGSMPYSAYNSMAPMGGRQANNNVYIFKSFADNGPRKFRFNSGNFHGSGHDFDSGFGQPSGNYHGVDSGFGQGGNYPDGNYHGVDSGFGQGGNYPGGNMGEPGVDSGFGQPDGNYPGGNYPGGNMGEPGVDSGFGQPDGNYPGGNYPDGNMGENSGFMGSGDLDVGGEGDHYTTEGESEYGEW